MRPPIVLLVDDEVGLHEALRMVLEYEGVVLHSAGDAASGIRKMKETQYDVVIIDYRMRGGDGDGLIEWIRSGATDSDKGATPRTVPIVLMSGGITPAQLRAVQPSVDEFFYKPLADSGEILGVIFRLVPSPLHRAAGVLRDAPFAHADWTSWMDDFGEPGLSIGCVSVDIDDCSDIRFKFGGKAFDEDVLPEVARFIERAARYRGHAYLQAGAGQFLLLLPNQTLEEVSLAADHLRANLATQTFRGGTREMSLTVSVGVALAPTHGTDFWPVHQLARAARLEARWRGGNQVVVAAFVAAVS
jgi:diguanylate cyclase (GGDEF)-like protein